MDCRAVARLAVTMVKSASQTSAARQLIVFNDGQSTAWRSPLLATMVVLLSVLALEGFSGLANSGVTAVVAGLCLWGTLASHCGDDGANSWEIRLATVNVWAFCGPIVGANFGSCGWNAYPFSQDGLDWLLD